MKLSSQIFTLIFVLLAKFTLAFFGNDLPDTSNGLITVHASDHVSVAACEIYAADEIDSRSADEEDDDRDDVSFYPPSVCFRFLASHASAYLSGSGGDYIRAAHLFLLYGNFRN